MKDWDAIKNKKKHFMERTHCHCPIRNWDQFSSVSWQEPEQEDYQQHWWRRRTISSFPCFSFPHIEYNTHKTLDVEARTWPYLKDAKMTKISCRTAQKPTLWHIINPIGLFLGNILGDPRGQDSVKGLLLSSNSLLFEDEPLLVLGMWNIKICHGIKFLKHKLMCSSTRPNPPRSFDF